MKNIKEYSPTHLSPFQLLFIMAVSIFVIEAIIMVIFFYLGPTHSLFTALVDSTLLVVMLFPVLYFFLFRPLLQHMTERRKFEDGLRNQMSKAQMYLDVAGVMLMVIDTSGKVTLINRKGCEILGYGEGEVLGKDWIANFTPKETREDGLPAFRSEGRTFFEYPVLRKDGVERIMIWHATPLSEGGRTTGTLFSGEDITERIRIESALIESETRYRLVHDRSFDGIIISDAGDRVIECNPSAEKIFGYGKGEMIGMNLMHLMPEKYHGRHLEGLKTFLETGTSYIQGKVLELEGLRKNGEDFPIDLILSSFKVGGQINFAGTIRDITERKKAEEAREKIQAQLNQAQKMDAVGRLAGGIAHDFNNVLTAISGNAELVLEDLQREDPIYQRLEEIRLSVVHASRLTRQLLLFSRGHKFELNPLNINTTAENLLMMLKRLIGEDIVVKMDLAPDAWSVGADEGNIEQLLLNLAVNARDAMPEGGRLVIRTENLKITEEEARRMTGARAGSFVCLTVRDSGSGIDEETLPHIFEPFYTTKEAGKGTGLGLAVVYGIVTQHAGWITVESTPGVGTSFKTFLPTSGAQEGRETEQWAAKKRPRGNGERVLLVEDERRVREVTKRVVSDGGYTVFDAEDARAAIELFEKEDGEFDLVLSDVVLSDFNGVELAKELTSRNPNLKVLLTSGYVDDKSNWEVIDRMGFRFLQKPYSIDDLLGAVKNTIELD
jgi:PAS domain S-box-containing protein